MKAAPEMQGADYQADIMKAVDAIGHFRQYLMGVKHTANQAQKTIDDCEAELGSIHEDELSEAS